MTDANLDNVNDAQSNTIESTLEGGAGFSYIKLRLKSGQTLKTESGAMASMDPGIDMRAKLNGGFIGGLLMKFLGKESLFLGIFRNKSPKPQNIVVTQNTPGQICTAHLNNQTLYIQPGSFVAASEGVSFGLRWAGFSSWIGGEGLFRIRISGTGTVWYGAFGAVVEKQIEGEYIVDTGHLLSYPETIKLKAQLSGGIFSSFFGGEGIVLRLEGKGKVKLQTRSIGGLTGWLNPRFRG